jgi:hypothetical protein
MLLHVVGNNLAQTGQCRRRTVQLLLLLYYYHYYYICIFRLVLFRLTVNRAKHILYVCAHQYVIMLFK